MGVYGLSPARAHLPAPASENQSGLLRNVGEYRPAAIGLAAIVAADESGPREHTLMRGQASTRKYTVRLNKRVLDNFVAAEGHRKDGATAIFAPGTRRAIKSPVQKCQAARPGTVSA
jgi:hypothetical protein